MRKQFLTRILSVTLVCSVAFNMGFVNDISANAAVSDGIPYTTEGTYDVSVSHVLINQVYGGGNNKGAGSHGFIELYNPTDSEVDLSGWSLQYLGAEADDKNDPGWHKLDLTGKIGAHCSYLVRTKKYKDDTTPANYTVPEGDRQWDDITINGKGITVALMSNNDLLTTKDIFDNTTHKPKVDGYVDMIGVTGNDNLVTQQAPAYEGYATASQSTKKGVRRIAFKDTDCNAVGEDDGDFVIIEYNATDTDYLEWAHPRKTTDGAWTASEMPEFKETTSLSETAINTLTNCIGTDSTHTRTFTWQMPVSVTAGQVKISKKEDMSSSVNVTATVHLNHKGTANVFNASATELTEGTTYYYQVECGDVKSDVYSFKTAVKGETFTFVHASDSQSKTESGYDIYKQAITNITNTYKPAFILESGDLVDTNYFEDEWRWFIQKSQDMFANNAFFPVVGNHEASSSYPAWAMREHFTVPNYCTSETVTPGTVYSYDYGNAHFAILNTENKEGFQAEKEWLAKDLAATKQKFIIVSFHRGIYGGNGIATDVRDAFLSTIDMYNVDLVLFGHDHSYIRTKALKNGVEDKNGTVYLEGGGCASKQDSANSNFPEYAEITATPGAPCYNVITVTDKEIQVKTVTVDLINNTINSLQDNASIVTSGNDANIKVDFTIKARNRRASIDTEETTTAASATQKPTTAAPSKTKVTVKKPIIKAAVKKKSAKKLSVILKKVSKARGYVIKVSTSKKFGKKKTKTIVTKRIKITIKKLKPNRKYYVKARAFKVVGKKKIYSPWSKTVKVKNK